MQKLTDQDAEKVRAAQEAEVRAFLATGQNWFRHFDERQQRLIKNCCAYSQGDPAGLPGHNLMIIVSKMALLLDEVG